MKEHKENLKGADIKTEAENKKKNGDKMWKKPTFEDVSEKIMAQPYIRFT